MHRYRILMGIVLLTLLLAVAAFGHGEAPNRAPMYIGRAAQNIAIRSERDREAEPLAHFTQGDSVYVIDYEPGWLLVTNAEAEQPVIGYVLRHTVHDIKAIDAGASPYGATPGAYSCVLTREVTLHELPDASSPAINTMQEGTKVAILSIEDGWASVIHWRQHGYFYLDAASELTPVYDAASAQPGDTIAAFVSFFSQKQTGLNPNRILNIEKACDYISIELAPEASFSFNGIAGPYLKQRGYLPAPSFVAGETVPSNGGGTCQVSSTLYNTLLPLTAGEGGIEILYRVAHGAGGISYLPHGVDAACGNESIDLKFQNDYPFPIRLEARATGGVLYIAVIKG